MKDIEEFVRRAMAAQKAVDALGAGRSVESSAVRQIKEKVRMVVADRASFGVLSTGEKCAVALVLNDAELMKRWGTALDCAHRVGTEWLEACVKVQRDGWDE